MNWLTEDVGPPFGFWTKGHISKEQLLKEAYREFDTSFILVAGVFRQTHYRCIPDTVKGWTLLHETKPGQGAFPVTVFEFI